MGLFLFVRLYCRVGVVLFKGIASELSAVHHSSWHVKQADVSKPDRSLVNSVMRWHSKVL